MPSRSYIRPVLPVIVLGALTVLPALSMVKAAPSVPPTAAAVPDTEQAQRFIEQSERQWAESLGTGDTKVVETILAEDLAGFDPFGNSFDRAGMIDQVHQGPKLFVSDRINSVKVRLLGSVAVAQGDESWEMKAGDPKRGRFVFTDTWALRDGKWQVVASQTTVAPDANP